MEQERGISITASGLEIEYRLTFHQVFLYHLTLNGIRVVWELI
jgi:hypothetical protein